jgi:hypothetical protein
LISETERFTVEKKWKAVHSLPDFFDLIQFRGRGMKSFPSQYQHDLIKFISHTNEGYKLDDEPWLQGKNPLEDLPFVLSRGSRRKMVLMPRGHLKSTIGSVGKTLWLIYKNPNIRIFVGCGNLGLSSAFMREMKAYLEDTFLIQHVWNARPHYEGPLIPKMSKTMGLDRHRPDKNETQAADHKVIWTSDAIQVIRPDRLREPTVMVGSVGTIKTGFHFDHLVFDDIQTYDNTKTPQLIEVTMKWVDDLESVLDPYSPERDLGGSVDVLGTRYQQNDYYGYCLEGLEYVSYDLMLKNIYQNGVDNSDGYLWPEKWNDEEEKMMRGKLRRNPKRFASQYLNRIIADEFTEFDVEDLQVLDKNAITKWLGS